MLDPVAHAVLDMPLQNDLSAAVERGFCGVDLCKHILAGDILIHHTLDRLYLTDYLLQPAVQIFGIHALLHNNILLP